VADAPTGPLVAESPAMRTLFAKAERVARSESTILITGETGVGKERMACWVHAHSPRAASTFMPVNCATFPATLLDTHLFGHVRGAFTGAVQAAAGLFETAAGGTLFLDEIGEVSPAVQGKLLRVLEEQKVQRVGEWRVRPIDVRLIAATNRDLNEEVAQGRFRKDLLFRLRVVACRPSVPRWATPGGHRACADRRGPGAASRPSPASGGGFGDFAVHAEAQIAAPSTLTVFRRSRRLRMWSETRELSEARTRRRASYDGVGGCRPSVDVGRPKMTDDPCAGGVEWALHVGPFPMLQGRQFLDGLSSLGLGRAQFIQALKVEPEFGARSEEMCQAQRGVAGDGALTVENLRHTIGGHVEPPREFSRAHRQGVKFFGQVLSWVNGDTCHGVLP